MSFKLLAIRPLHKCNTNFRKNLEENRIYQFYNDYEFQDSNGNKITDFSKYIEVSKIRYNPIVPKNLFGDKISISAIVGKNGSGKSALVELLVAFVIKLSLEIKNDFINSERLYYDSNKDRLKEFITNFENSKIQDLKDINVEIFIIHKAEHCLIKNDKLECFGSNTREKIRKIVIRDHEILVTDYHYSFDNHNFFNKKLQITRENLKSGQKIEHLNISREELHFFQDFFYTMVINYSHYGYNSLETGEWLKGVFHKNDGYQLPVVINPLREEGNIDINSEKELSKSRFLVNILQEPSLRTISEGKEVKYLSIELNENKFIGFNQDKTEEWHDWNKEENRNQWLNISEEEKQEILNSLFSIFYEKENGTINTNHFFYPFIRDYIIFKLIRMRHYSVYEEFYDCFESNDVEVPYYDFPIIRSKFSIKRKEKLISYFKAIEQDTSHNTDKFRQALFFLKYLYLDKNDLYKKGINNKLFLVNELFERISNCWKLYRKDLPVIMQFSNDKFSIRESLPSIFKVNYFFEEKYSENNFDNFSSGEKQKIFSIHSVIYHLRNLKSVQSIHNHSNDNKDENNEGEKKKELIYYKNVNIIFDEIELYNHPDFQKKFINDLLKALNSVYQRFDNINLLFITHSPFILSDIPKQNVLFLENGKPVENIKMNTFGANITDLFADSFFFSNDEKGNKILMGDFAKEKINDVINFLNDIESNIKTYEECKSLIEIIDEPLLKTKLKEMLYEKASYEQKKEIIEKEILEKQKELEELKDLNNNSNA